MVDGNYTKITEPFMAKSVELGMLTSNTRAGAVRTWVERLWQDLRYGCRVLIGNPGFTTVAVLSIAIGIGANCAIFSFADALLLRPLPVPRPGELLTVGSRLSVEAFGG